MKEKAAVFVINSLQNGGAERVVVNQAIELDNRGIHVIVIMIHDLQFYNLPSTIETVVISKYMTGMKKLFEVPKLARCLDSKLDDLYSKYNIVLLTTNLPYSHYICRFSKYYRKFMFVMHSSQYRFPHSKSMLFKAKMSFLYRKANVVAVSEGVRDELVSVYRLDAKKVVTIYNPISFDDISNEMNANSDTDTVPYRYILGVGRLCEEKNFDTLIKAFKKSRIFLSHKLVILGIGDDKDKLEKLAHELYLDDQVVFYGWSNEVYYWMKNADLFVCSSKDESFGMALLEALYCGCPVVSVSSTGPREIMCGNLKHYLSENDVDDLSDKMIDALRYYPEIKKDYFERFDVNKIMDEYLKEYNCMVIKNEL